MMQIVDYFSQDILTDDNGWQDELLASYTYKIIYQFPSLLGYWGAQIYDEKDTYLTRIDLGETNNDRNSLSYIAYKVVLETEQLSVERFNREQKDNDD